MKTAFWFLKLTIPISLAVTLLNHFGLLQIVSDFLSPAFNLIGVRGEGALVYITGIFLNVYSSIAVLSSLSFTLREATILAIMSLIAHNLIIETAVQRKTGSKTIHIILLRIISSIVAAVLLNLFLPVDMGMMKHTSAVTEDSTFWVVLSEWSINTFFLCIKIVILITLLMILQKLLVEFRVNQILADIFKPFLKVMGLPESTSFMWIVANLLGLAYGSAVMIDEVETGRLSKEDADLLNFHIGISHSNLEDLLLFATMSISAGWLLFPRLGIAIVAVWGRRLWISK